MADLKAYHFDVVAIFPSAILTYMYGVCTTVLCDDVTVSAKIMADSSSSLLSCAHAIWLGRIFLYYNEMLHLTNLQMYHDFYSAFG